MTRIYNTKLKKEILIDETHECVSISPKFYEQENPHFDIELKFIDLGRHSYTCSDCKTFLDALGTDDLNWFIEFNNKNYRLDLSKLGTEHTSNRLQNVISYYFQGTRLRLLIFKESLELLEQKLEELIEEEKYEQCSALAKQIEALRSN